MSLISVFDVEISRHTKHSLEMPPLLLLGMRLELSRARLLPNTEEKSSEWMDFLYDNYSEIQAGLGAEQAIFESPFVRNDEDSARWSERIDQLFLNNPHNFATDKNPISFSPRELSQDPCVFKFQNGCIGGLKRLSCEFLY